MLYSPLATDADQAERAARRAYRIAYKAYEENPTKRGAEIAHRCAKDLCAISDDYQAELDETHDMMAEHESD
jgi:hypothetical protein